MGLAAVLVCEKCGKKCGKKQRDSGKNPSHQLASKLKRLGKQEFDKGDLRMVLTSCLDLCPDDRIAVALVPARHDQAAVFLEVEADDLDASSLAIVNSIRRLTGRGRE